jgi:hypothetical protein
MCRLAGAARGLATRRLVTAGHAVTPRSLATRRLAAAGHAVAGRGRVGAPDDPLEQARVLVGDGQARVARAGLRARVGEAQHVAVGHAVALAVLDRLVREPVRGLAHVPRADAAAQAATPAAELLDVAGEREQVRAGAAHVRQRVEGELARRLVVRRRGHREREDRRVVLRRAAVTGDRHDLAHGARAVGRDRASDRHRVATRQLLLTRVVRAALGAEDQEAPQARPVVDGPREAAGGVRHLDGVRDRLALARAPEAEAGQVVDRDLPPFSWVGDGRLGTSRSCV